MSKLLAIEEALGRTDAATFHRLSEAYLYRRGYRHPHAIGLVFGSSKTRTGTPDTLLPEEDGMYVFAEYTTQKEQLEAKLVSDIEKCLDEKKTSIPVNRIREIILCYSGYLATDAVHRLAEMGKAAGVVVRTVNGAELSHALSTDFPGLARDFLGIEVDTGQVLSVEDFVELSGRSAFATPLDTRFQFREEDVNRVLTQLETRDVVLISGRSGIGKSRLAVECCQNYSEKRPQTIVKCIVHRGKDLFEDLRIHLAPPGEYLLLVDDANRVSRFDYILDLQREARDDRSIKVVATVRDYALESMVDSALRFTNPGTVSVSALSDEQIRQLISAEGGITDYDSLQGIEQLAQGNPRLALMAAKVIRETGRLSSLDSTNTLYDEYYRSIRKDLDLSIDRSLLLTIGVIAFFRLVDGSNAEQMTMIEHVFGISAAEFWRAVRVLHEMEAVDLYENEVVKISDQVLATYLLFLAIFRERVLPIKVLLENFFPAHRHRIVDALSPMFLVFDRDELRAKLEPEVRSVFAAMDTSGQKDAALHLLDLFWFLMPTEALQYVASVVSGASPSPEPPPDLHQRDDVPYPSALSILSRFADAEAGQRRTALQLIARYAAADPARSGALRKILLDAFGVRPGSIYTGFATEHDVFDVLASETSRDGGLEVRKLLLAYSEQILHTHFQHTEGTRKGISIVQFDVPHTKEFTALRAKAWGVITEGMRDSSLRQAAVETLRAYGSAGLYVDNKEIVEEDFAILSPALVNNLDRSNYQEAALARLLFDHARRLGIAVHEGTLEHFKTAATRVADLLLDDWLTRQELGFEEYSEAKTSRINEFVRDATEQSIRDFLSDALTIRSVSTDGHDRWEIDNSLRQILMAYGDSNIDSLLSLLEEHFASGNPLEIAPEGIVGLLIRSLSVDDAYAWIAKQRFPRVKRWLSVFFAESSAGNVDGKWGGLLLRHYSDTPSSEWVADLSFLLRYESGTPGIFIEAVTILTERVEQFNDSVSANLLGIALSSRGDIGRDLKELFHNTPSLLKRTYFAASSIREGVDYDGSVFDLLVSIDEDFPEEWVRWSYKRKDTYGPGKSGDLSRIWKRGDYRAIARRIVDADFAEWKTRYLHNSPLGTLFAIIEGTKDRQLIADRQDAILQELIHDRAMEREFIKYLFGLIGNMSPSRRKAHIATLLSQNPDFDLFASIPLEPTGWSAKGSWVPVLQARIDFFTSLLPVCESAELLRHRQYVENRIATLRSRQSEEKRSDFLEHGHR